MISLSRLLLVILALMPLGLLRPADGGDFHPQDGPHVDVRLFIEEEVVRIRLEMNLVFLDEMVDFPRENGDRISTMEWTALPSVLEAFFETEHPVIINGTRVRPSFEKLQINDPDLRLLPLFPVSGERGLRKVRFELVYPVSDPPPASVDFGWTTFPPNILLDAVDPPPLAIAAELDAEGVRTPLIFSRTEPGYVWYATGAGIESRLMPVPGVERTSATEVPVLAIGLFMLGSLVVVVGLVAARSSGSSQPVLLSMVIEGPLLAAGVAALLFGWGTWPMGGGTILPDSEEAEAIFRPLHANVYRAFDFVAEDDVYDALARSADGGFLDTIYRTIYRGLVMQEEGGAVARVSEVRPIEVDVSDIELVRDEQGVERPGFEVTCLWQVDGVVSHWGHAHRRTNEYLANWSVREFDEGWRFTASEILAQDRIDESSTDPDDDPDHELEELEAMDASGEFEV